MKDDELHWVLKWQSLSAEQQWQSVSEGYAHMACEPNWEHWHPMVELTSWAGRQLFSSRLYPDTSHEWLCVHLLPGYNPDQPFFSCGVQRNGEFEFALWARVGSKVSQEIVPIDQAHRSFEQLAGFFSHTTVLIC